MFSGELYPANVIMLMNLATILIVIFGAAIVYQRCQKPTVCYKSFKCPPTKQNNLRNHLILCCLKKELSSQLYSERSIAKLEIFVFFYSHLRSHIASISHDQIHQQQYEITLDI